MELHQINESYVEIGDIADCFYSFFWVDDTLFSVHRRHRIFSMDRWPKTENENVSQIILTAYKHKDFRQVEYEECLTTGNDPRAVSDGKSTYIICEGAVYEKDRYKLISFPDKKIKPLQLGKNTQYGKNWQPYLKEGKLYVVSSIAPFMVYAVNLETAVVSFVEEKAIDFTIKAPHDHYAMLRGGSNAIFTNNSLYGWGHATTDPFTHIPYTWHYQNDVVNISFLHLHSFFNAKGYSIVDTCSFFEWDKDTFALSLSCSQREWFHSQWFVNALVLFRKEDLFEHTFNPIKGNINQKPMLFHATQLDTLIESTIQIGGRNNQAKQGCLVCGPSKAIDTNVGWKVNLHYASINKSTTRVGKYDLYLTIDGVDKQLAEMSLYGTEGETVKVSLSFDKIIADTVLIQTRVFAKKRKDITAYFFELKNEN